MRLTATAVCALTLLSGCGPKAPGQEAFDTANARLTTFTKQVSFGNGPVAVQLAERFSTRMKLMREIGFSKSKLKGPMLSEGQFLTHCQLTDNSILFLVNVPEFRDFKEDAQGQLLDLAWTAARRIAERFPDGKEMRVGVGLRGTLLYGGAVIGTAASDIPDVKTNTGVVSLDGFYPFFIGAYPSDVALAPEGTAQAEAAPAPAEAPVDATPPTVIEAAGSGDRIAASLGTLDMSASSTVIAISPDLFVASMTKPMLEGGMKPARGSLIRVRNVGALPDRNLVLLRPVGPLKFEPIAALGGAPSPGTTVTTYFARATGTTYTEVQKFTSKVTAVDEAIHTDQRLDFIPQGAALVDDQGRLIGIGTAENNVYATVTDIRRLIEAARTKSPQ
jgi:hypothetical protein